MTSRYPPGPDKTIFDAMHSTLRQGRDRLGFLIDIAQTYGDIVHFHTGLRHIFLLNHPDLIRSVLVEQAEHFNRTRPVKHAMGRFLGTGLLVIDGDFHHRERRLVQPAFHHKRIEAYADIMVDHTRRVMSTWQDGHIYSIDQEMMKITLGIVASTLFSADVSGDAEIVGQALTTLQEAVIHYFRSLIHPPDWFPTARRRKEEQAVQTLDQIIYRIIRERMASGEDKGDLLSMLLLSVDADGSKMDIEQVRHETITLFLAGHETTANTLTWISYLLAQHPDKMAKLRQEVDCIPAGQDLRLQDIDHLPYTRMVVKEGLRLYPPAWVITREAADDVTVGGYRLKAGSVMVISPYVTHRHPRYFPEPKQFQPERFANEGEKDWPRFAYFPFGGGPHICIGQSFALLEATLILATLAQHYDFSLIPDQTVSMEPLISLRARHGIRMKVTRRRVS